MIGAGVWIVLNFNQMYPLSSYKMKRMVWMRLMVGCFLFIWMYQNENNLLCARSLECNSEKETNNFKFFSLWRIQLRWLKKGGTKIDSSRRTNSCNSPSPHLVYSLKRCLSSAWFHLQPAEYNTNIEFYLHMTEKPVPATSYVIYSIILPVNKIKVVFHFGQGSHLANFIVDFRQEPPAHTNVAVFTKFLFHLFFHIIIVCSFRCFLLLVCLNYIFIGLYSLPCGYVCKTFYIYSLVWESVYIHLQLLLRWRECALGVAIYIYMSIYDTHLD